MKRLVSTDTSAAFNYELFKKQGINTFALNVIVDGEEYLDGITINQDTLRDAMRSGKNIKTSTPPLGEVIEYFENLFSQGYDEIIHFTISSKFSSMYNLFNGVAETHFPGKLFVVDSYGVTVTMLAQVLLANEEVKKGTDTQTILKMVEDIKQDCKITFVPENLTALKNGGRISPTIALIGNVLGIKPVIALMDGGLEKEGTTKQVRKTIIETAQNSLQRFPTSDYEYNLVSFDAKPEVVDYIKNNIAQVCGLDEVLVGLVPVNVCAHCGPGTLGLIITKKINGKSLKEFL